MKLSQFMLLKLGEECAEVAQRCSKQIQFGKNQSQSKDGISLKKVDGTNSERLRGEIIDLFCCVKALIELDEIESITSEELFEAYKTKLAKIEKYLNYSIDMGEITIDD